MTVEEKATHVAYELDMLLACLDEADKPVHEWVVQNALLESFAVHFRGLYDFLLQKPCGDDVGAIAFDSSWDAEVEAVNAVALKSAKVRVNKEVAHLTEQRGQGKPWDCERLAMDLVDLVARFRKRLPTSTPARLIQAIAEAEGWSTRRRTKRRSLFPDPPAVSASLVTTEGPIPPRKGH